MNQLQICDNQLDFNSNVYIIAEACDNHFGNINRAFEMCRLAKIAGASAIKFQHHIVDKEMSRDCPSSDNFSEPLYDFLERCSLTIDQHNSIKRYCADISIDYLCTPFSYDAAVELVGIGQNCLKIGSGELLDFFSLERIATLGTSLILSTGMAEPAEIKDAVDNITKINSNIALLNCVSEYPTLYQDLPLRFINSLMSSFPNCLIGHSDHTADNYTSYAAVTLGAKIIEKHVTLDKKDPGPDQSVSIDFNDLHHLVDGIKKIELSMNSIKRINSKEVPIRTWAYRSLFSKTDFHKGQSITEEMLTTMRPGTGIPSREWRKYIGKVCLVDIPKGTMLQGDMFS